MADTSTKTPVTPTPNVAEQLIAKLATLKTKHEAVAGHKGHNPFFVLKKIDELVKRIKAGDIGDAIKKEVDSIPSEPVKLVDTTPEQTAAVPLPKTLLPPVVK